MRVAACSSSRSESVVRALASNQHGRRPSDAAAGVLVSGAVRSRVGESRVSLPRAPHRAGVGFRGTRATIRQRGARTPQEPAASRSPVRDAHGLAQGLAYLLMAVVLAIVFDAARNPPATAREGLAVAGKLLALFVAFFGFMVWRLVRVKNK